MNRYFNEKSNYDKYPVVNVPGMEEECRVGWRAISDRLEKDLSQIGKKVKVVVLECYQGVSDEEVVTALQSAFPASRWFFSADAHEVSGTDRCHLEAGHHGRRDFRLYDPSEHGLLFRRR